MSVRSKYKQVNVRFADYLPSQNINLFPRIYDFETLPLNNKLKLIKIVDFRKINSKKLLIKFVLQITNSKADVYLHVNKIKRDMFYSVPAGEYSFGNIELNSGKNLIEIFYIQNGYKSKSTYLVVKV